MRPAPLRRPAVRRIMEATSGQAARLDVLKMLGRPSLGLNVLGMIEGDESESVNLRAFNMTRGPSKIQWVEGVVFHAMQTPSGSMLVTVESEYFWTVANEWVLWFLANKCRPWDKSNADMLGVKHTPKPKPQTRADAPESGVKISTLADRMRARRRPA